MHGFLPPRASAVLVMWVIFLVTGDLVASAAVVARTGPHCWFRSEVFCECADRNGMPCRDSTALLGACALVAAAAAAAGGSLDFRNSPCVLGQMTLGACLASRSMDSIGGTCAQSHLVASLRLRRMNCFNFANFRRLPIALPGLGVFPEQ